MTRKVIILSLALLLVLVIVLGGVDFAVQHQQRSEPGGGGTAGTGGTTVPTAPFQAGMPHVEGTQIIDASGKPLLLRGAQIESPFNYVKGWEAGKRPTATLNSRVFRGMALDWKMNTLRLPLSNWIYATDPSGYMNQLDQVVQQANASGLYVVMDLHDDKQSGSPYGVEANLPKTEDIPFWKAIASHFKSNPMIMFDLFNEPREPNWPTWLHGGTSIGGAKTVGFMDMIAAVRSVGAPQIIVLEPGSAGKGVGGNAEGGGWATFGANINAITDPNVIYSLHVYEGITATPAQFDAKWGPILHHRPIYYGEWALLTNAPGQAGLAHCAGIARDQADLIVTSFLNYMGTRQASWSAWQFAPHYLIHDYATFTPTSLDIPWSCGDTSSYAGMGQLVKNYLANH